MIFIGEDDNSMVWQPEDELPCGCRFTPSQIITLFGQHVGGERGLTCVHGHHYVFSVEVLTQFKFKIQKGIQP